MLIVNYPEPAFRIKKENGKNLLFDPLRKKWLQLTNEEWVRQNFIQYLVQVLNYPPAMIAIEKSIWLGELKKRFDILIYDSNHKPWLIVECKAGSVSLNDTTLQQALRYNMSVPVDYLVITNGKQTYGWQKSGVSLQPLQQLPSWKP